MRFRGFKEHRVSCRRPHGEEKGFNFAFLQMFSFAEPVGVRHYVTLYIIPAPAGQNIYRNLISTHTPNPVGM